MASIIENWIIVTIAPLIVIVVVILLIPTLAGQGIFDATTSNMITSTGTALEDFGPILVVIAVGGGIAVLLGGRR